MIDHVSAHFVTFYSPGTFVPEQRTLSVENWDIAAATALADSVVERYGATPHSFRFSTRSRGPEDLDSKETSHSPLYFLGGKIETLAEVKARATKEDETLLWNMEHNDIPRIVTNENSFKATIPFQDGDVMLDYTPPTKRAPA